MKANQVATLVLRLLGIYMLVESIPLVFRSFTPAYDTISTGAVLLAFWSLLFIGSRIIMGILLITLSVSWGEKLTPKSINNEAISPITFEQAQTLAFAVAGVLIFAGTLPQLFVSIVSLLLSLLRFKSAGDALVYPFMVRDSWYSVETSAGMLLKAALGLWLFFGAHGFANFWRSLRNFGTPKPPQAP